MKPGDPGFKYDKREEFNPKLPCEWDKDLQWKLRKNSNINIKKILYFLNSPLF